MVQPVVIDPREITVTPVFMHIELENIPKSEASGHKVMELHEIVEVRFAGSKHYSPRFPVNEQHRRDGINVITYAERWPEQYRAFKEGNSQEAMGTPLEMLRPMGVTPEQLSLCRALRIYSIEALDALEGQAIKSLGMNANVLREAARKFLADRGDGARALDEISALKARIAELEALSTLVPLQDSTPAEIEAAIAKADASFADMSDTDIKDEIERLAGTRPRGNPSRETLENLLNGLLAA